MNGGYAFHDAHLVYCLWSPHCRTTSMGLFWTAHSVVSPLLASRLAFGPSLVLGVSLWMYGGTRLPTVRGSLRSPSTWRRMCSLGGSRFQGCLVTSFAIFFTAGLPANLLGTSSQAHQLAMSLNAAKFYLG